MKKDYSKEVENNIRTLIEIRDNPDTTPAVRIQAVQTLQKIMDAEGVISEDRVSEEDIMKKIRGAKK